MSIKAIDWAFHIQSPMLTGTDAFVLVALADNADESGRAYPSIETIARKTKHDRKTVIFALQRLVKHGFIQDTGKRMGATKKVKVYRLRWADERAEAVPKQGQLSSPETGTIKQSLNDAETVPISPETVPISPREPSLTVINPPPAVPLPLNGGQLQADSSRFITDFREAKRIICERILNGKDPNRLWSVDAYQRLLKHLPIPRQEIERVAWFRTKPLDGSPELEARKPITETGLMAYWGDEVTRASPKPRRRAVVCNRGRLARQRHGTPHRCIYFGMSAQADSHRMPPHSMEAEQGVLASMFLSRDAIAEAADKITPEYFFVPPHRQLFEVMVDLWRTQRAVDLITFTQELRDRNLLDNVGGAAYVTDIHMFVPTAANIGYYIDILRDKQILRRLITAGTEMVRRAYEEQAEVSETLEQSQKEVLDVGGLARSNSRTLDLILPEAEADILWRYRNRGKCTGISTGFPDLDRMMNGFEPGARPYCFAARPSMGKSSLMLGFAKYIAIINVVKKKRIKIFSAEMTAPALAQRLIAGHADFDLTAIRYGMLPKNVKERLSKAVEELTTNYIDVDDDGSINILQLRSRARSAVVHGKCELVMVDYLQRVHGSSKRSKDNRQLEIAEVAQGLSEMAKELRVPVVVLAQLNRNPEDRKDGKPELGDLRESGAIEQEMGFVGLLWRPSYYATNESKREALMKATRIDDERDFDSYVECIVAKQNNGPTGPIPLRFIERFARFEAQDPDRPFLSNRPDLRQYNDEDQGGMDDADEALLQSIKDVFPGAELGENGDE